MAKKSDIISEYEAASITYMSPDLLRWLTSHAPKSGLDRKLKVAKEENGTVFFERDEVLAFDAWLKQPWPRKNGQRPGIPSGIRREIKHEANGSCAICQGHKDTCEAAHLDPVAKTDNNHPENLLWLCSNHHTAYDGGLFGPTDDEVEFVAGFKTSLRRYKVMLWRMQAALSLKVLTALENCDLLHKQLASAKTQEQVGAIETVAKDILDKLPTMAPMSKSDPRYRGFQTVSAKIGKLSKSKRSVRQRLSVASTVRSEYVEALGMVACPLCKATGRYDGNDCPVCDGDREIEERDAKRLDLSQFTKVDCPLCDGGGTYEGETCPACGGECTMEQRYADRIDVSDYRRVQCPICEGSGNYEGTTCHACGGEGDMEQRYADRIDVSDYRRVQCPICEGSGNYEGTTCHACGGEGDMERRHLDMLDVRSYEIVACPLCERSGRHEHSDCPECGGEGTMQRRFADEVDLQDYELAECPVCTGLGKLRGEDCPACQGEGSFDRRYLDRIDVRDYELVACPLCKNKANKRDECRACGGYGEMEKRFADDIDPRDYR